MNKKENTSELLNSLISTEDITSWNTSEENSLPERTLSEYLAILLERYNLNKKKIILTANLDITYGYQIFQGIRKPSRENLLKLAFGFPLTVEETKNLLYYGNANTLYPRVKRDAYILFGLHKKYSFQEMNQLLFDQNEQTFDID